MIIGEAINALVFRLRIFYYIPVTAQRCGICQGSVRMIFMFQVGN